MLVEPKGKAREPTRSPPLRQRAGQLLDGALGPGGCDMQSMDPRFAGPRVETHTRAMDRRYEMERTYEIEHALHSQTPAPAPSADPAHDHSWTRRLARLRPAHGLTWALRPHA